MIKLNIGTVVMLRSGGPPMSAFEFHEELIDCCWMANGVLMRDTFHFDELVELVTKDIEYDPS